MDAVRQRHTPIVSPFAAPLARASAPLLLEPVDVVCASAAPQPQGWRQGLWKAAKIAILSTVTATTVIGTIAFVGNKDAIFAPVTVSRPVEAVPAAPSHPPAPHPVPPAPAPRPAPLVGIISAPRVQRLATQIEDTPAVRAAMQERVAEARAMVEDRLENLPPIELNELLDVHAPLPTGERAFLHVGSIDLPSGGLSQLQTENIPLAVRGRVVPGAVAVSIDIRPQTPERAPQGPQGAVYLGSFRTVVRPAADSVHVEGKVEVVSDVDGRATQQALQQWRARQASTPASSPQRAAIDGNVTRLEARARQIARLAELAPTHHFESILSQTLADQGATFSRDIPMNRDVPLVQGVHHAWIGRGGELLVTEELRTPGIDALVLRDEGISPLAHQAAGGLLGEKLNAVVRERVQQEIASQLHDYGPQIPAMVSGVVRDAWSDATRIIEREGRTQVRQAFDKYGTIPVAPAHPGQNLAVSLNVRAAAPTTNGGLGARGTVDVGNSHLSGDVSRFLANPSLFPAAVQHSPAEFAVSGEMLNTTLRDVHEGGAVDWKSFLDDVARQNKLKSLEFDRDDAGRMMSPQLVWKNGRPVLELELSAQTRGILPLPVLESGTGERHVSLEGAGLPLGSVLDGVGSILVGSIGGLLNPFPMVSMHMSIPVQLETVDGVLTLRPDAAAVEVTAPQGESSYIPLPTTILQRLMAQLLVGSNNHIGEKLQGVSIPIDLREQGIRITAAQAMAPEGRGTAPDLVFGVDPRVPAR